MLNKTDECIVGSSFSRVKVDIFHHELFNQIGL